MRRINLIVIHCSATRADRHYTEAELTADHLRRGFSEAGYHYYIRLNGDIKSLRSVEKAGAHARGYNASSIAVCYEGGLDITGQPRDTRTQAQKTSLLRLIRHLLICFPGSWVCGHRDHSEDLNGDGTISPDEWIKQCPSFNAIPEYKELVYELRKK